MIAMDFDSDTSRQELETIAEGYITIEYVETLIFIDQSLKKSYNRKCLRALFEKMGATLYMGWVIYWPPEIIERKPQNLHRGPCYYTSGFASEGRGIHWDVQKKWIHSKKKS